MGNKWLLQISNIPNPIAENIPDQTILAPTPAYNAFIPFSDTIARAVPMTVCTFPGAVCVAIRVFMTSNGVIVADAQAPAASPARKNDGVISEADSKSNKRRNKIIEVKRSM